MGMRNKGYVYTLMTVGTTLLILSLIIFYFYVEEYPVEEAVTRMSMDELHYFVESVKKDCARSVAISGQRAATYAVNHVIERNMTLRDYEMRNCSGFHYPVNGSEAAIAELMYCGTFEGGAGGPAEYMGNHTVRDWVGRISNFSGGMSYRASVVFRNLTIAPYDSWNLVVVSNWDIIVADKINRTQYAGRDVALVSIVPVNTLEDPAFHMYGGVPSILRYIHKCPTAREVNASILDHWIDEGCYNARNNTQQAPCFLDRLDGSKDLNGKYVSQSEAAASALGYDPRGIGLESLLNLDMLGGFNVTVDGNRSQIDYLYWLDTPAYCGVRGMRHSGFRIDTAHALDYGVRGVECGVEITNQAGGDVFMPASMTVPLDTVITWSNPDAAGHLLSIEPDVWGEDVNLMASSSFSWEFEQPETYRVTCLEAGHGGVESLIEVVANLI